MYIKITNSNKMNELLLTMVIQYVIYKNLTKTGYPAAISSPRINTDVS